jgi:hypothetical protein
MNTTSQHVNLHRQKYIAEHAPALLGQILNGSLASGKEADPDVCASLATKAAGALYDQLIVSVG